MLSTDDSLAYSEILYNVSSLLAFGFLQPPVTRLSDMGCLDTPRSLGEHWFPFFTRLAVIYGVLSITTRLLGMVYIVDTLARSMWLVFFIDTARFPHKVSFSG